MFEPDEIPKVKQSIRDCAISDRKLLDELCQEVQQLKEGVRVIKSRSATTVSLVASDGGNNKLVYDPFYFQLVRVVDSNGERLCLDTISPTTNTAELSERQFNPDGTPKTALGRLMKDLGVKYLHHLSPMIPKPELKPDQISKSWVLTYRDLCEWAVLYERICYTKFGSNTLLVRDGLLRSKIFNFFKAKDGQPERRLFIEMMNNMIAAMDEAYKLHKREIFLVGLAKHSQVLSRYSLAMSLEDILPKGEPRYARVPYELELNSYTWKEFIWRPDEDKAGEVNKFSMGCLYLVRFGKMNSDPVWAVDLLPNQAAQDSEIFGYLLADSINGFPVPHYPLCLQRAHEHAQVVDFDMDILQDEVIKSIKDILPQDKRDIIEQQLLNTDQSQNRYS